MSHIIASTPSPSVHVDHVSHPPKASRQESVSTKSEGSSPSSQSDHFPFLTRFIHRTEETQSDIWVRDLELMHHWTVEAFDELSQRDDMRHTWRIDAPQHAVGHTFFMHEILAFAALHKARKLPEKRSQYYAFGIHHQDLAIRGVRAQLLNITLHEAPAIVATSTLLTLSVFASTGFELNYFESPGSQGAIDGILHIFNLMQGMANVLALAHAHVVNSWLAPMFRDPDEVIPSQPMLQDLISQLPRLISFIQCKHDLPESEKTIYLGVIASFEPLLQTSMQPCVDNRELRFLFAWPRHLQPDFLGLLRQRYDGAIAIVMYYCTILFASQSRYWFMDRWGEQLMRACFETLGQDWLPAVRWPASFINQNPTLGLFSNLAQSQHGPSNQLQHPTQSSFIYPQRKPVDVSYRQHATVPSPPHKTQIGHDVALYSQHPKAPQLKQGQQGQHNTPVSHTKGLDSTEEAQ
ncbi:hypothetical protein BDU57DRAFT_535138 [Ampelomyces quisqualis]|uniref:Uncharacterized protein n=1 Tax=Ampelomyces quisqualis TaxID=50730 RepID=A0A6A5R0A6_AMPQU|nr:hypothetical protein BDU57DRAFT_535138 [Ampelomyces quisqualis]